MSSGASAFGPVASRSEVVEAPGRSVATPYGRRLAALVSPAPGPRMRRREDVLSEEGQGRWKEGAMVRGAARTELLKEDVVLQGPDPLPTDIPEETEWRGPHGPGRWPRSPAAVAAATVVQSARSPSPAERAPPTSQGRAARQEEAHSLLHYSEAVAPPPSMVGESGVMAALSAMHADLGSFHKQQLEAHSAQEAASRRLREQVDSLEEQVAGLSRRAALQGAKTQRQAGEPEQAAELPLDVHQSLGMLLKECCRKMDRQSTTLSDQSAALTEQKNKVDTLSDLSDAVRTDVVAAFTNCSKTLDKIADEVGRLMSRLSNVACKPERHSDESDLDGHDGSRFEIRRSPSCNLMSGYSRPVQSSWESEGSKQHGSTAARERRRQRLQDASKEPPPPPDDGLPPLPPMGSSPLLQQLDGELQRLRSMVADASAAALRETQQVTQPVVLDPAPGHVPAADLGPALGATFGGFSWDDEMMEEDMPSAAMGQRPSQRPSLPQLALSTPPNAPAPTAAPTRVVRESPLHADLGDPLGSPRERGEPSGRRELTRVQSDPRKAWVASEEDMRLSGPMYARGAELAVPFAALPEDTDGCHQFLFHPQSLLRLGWDILGSALVVLCVWSVPLEFYGSLSPEVDLMVAYVFLQSAIFWTLDIVLNFRTGFYAGPCAIMDGKRIAFNYAKTWFPFDAVMVLLDWVEVVDGQDLEVEATAYALLMRLRRLLRLVKVATLLGGLQLRNNSSAVHRFSRAALALAGVVASCHVVAGVWFFVGERAGSGWLEAHLADSASSSEKVLASLNWATLQLRGGGGHFQLGTVGELALSCVWLVLGLGLLAAAAAPLVADLVRDCLIARHSASQRSALQSFLGRHRVKASTGAPLKLLAARASRLETEQDAERQLMALLPEKVRQQLLWDVRSPVMLQHHLLHLMAANSLQCTRRLADDLEVERVLPNVVVFHAGEDCRLMRLVLKGELGYQLGERESAEAGPAADPFAGRHGKEMIGRGAHVCEAALWTRWRTAGCLTSKTEGELLGCDCRALEQVTLQHPGIYGMAACYAIWFRRQVHSGLVFSDLFAPPEDWRSQVAVAAGVPLGGFVTPAVDPQDDGRVSLSSGEDSPTSPPFV